MSPRTLICCKHAWSDFFNERRYVVSVHKEERNHAKLADKAIEEPEAEFNRCRHPLRAASGKRRPL